MYNNKNSKLKQIVRDEIMGLYNGGKVLSLPSDNFIFERQMKETYLEAEIFTVEQDPDIYKRGLPIAKELGISHQESSLLDYLLTLKSQDSFNLIWLDFCGYWNDTLELTTCKALEHLEIGGYICLTILARRDRNLERLWNNVKKQRFHKPKDWTYTARTDGVSSLLKKYNERLMPMQYISYHDTSSRTNARSPMILLVYKLRDYNEVENNEILKHNYKISVN